MGLRFSRVGGGGGSWKIAVVYLRAHAPSKNPRPIPRYKHTSLIFLVGKFFEVPHSAVPMRQGFLYVIGDSKLRAHTFSAKLAPNSHKCCEKQQTCRKRDVQTLKIHREFIALWYQGGHET